MLGEYKVEISGFFRIWLKLFDSKQKYPRKSIQEDHEEKLSFCKKIPKNIFKNKNTEINNLKRFQLQIFNFIDFLIKFLIQLKFSILLLSGINEFYQKEFP